MRLETDDPVADGSRRLGVMIDRPGSRDRDDAIAVRRTDRGWRAAVHIAAAATLVPVGSRTDLAARRRLHTRYLPHRTLRMLPETDEQQAALTSGRPNTTVCFALDFDQAGTLLDVDVRLDRLDEALAMSYEEAAAAITDTEHPAHVLLAAAHELARTLLVRRRAGGALAGYDLVRGWATDEEGNVVHLGATERNAGYLVVQELMIATNMAAARWCAERELPILFRNHRLSAVAPPRQALLDDLEAVETDPVAARLDALEERLALVQRPAVYEPHVAGHYALNLPAYTHATSPLRRYPDLVNQRILLAAASGRPSPYTLDDLTAIAADISARLAEQRERRAERYRSEAALETRQQLAAGTFDDLRPGDFHRVVEAAVAENGPPPPALAEELTRRIATDRMAPRDACRILLFADDAWREMRHRVLDWVAASPAHAITIVTMYAAVEQLPPIAWDTSEIRSADGPTMFAVRATVRTPDRDAGPVSSPRRLAASKRLARQQAALGLLATLAGLPDPSRDLADPAAGRVAPDRLPDIPTDQHPVMTVNQFAQLGVLADLRWSYASNGPAHEPTHTCTAEATDSRTGTALCATGTARSKAAAKALAAAALLERLPR